MKEIFLNNKDLIFSYLTVNSVLLIAMAVGTVVYISPARLRSRGYSDEYIEFTRKVYIESILVLGLIFLFSQLILGIIVKLNDPEFTSYLERKEILFNWMKLEKWSAFIVLSLIILVAAFNIVSTLIMMVMDKTREIGILKSMGATNESIKRIFVYQGAFVGVCGTFIGCTVGYIICFIHIFTLNL